MVEFEVELKAINTIVHVKCQSKIKTKQFLFDSTEVKGNIYDFSSHSHIYSYALKSLTEIL